ncbi:MAG: SDR family NAD(P)-dependent oxidoreductase [Bacteroidota bacterium]
MKKAIVVGATSGIGRALALALGARGYAVGVTGRREDRLTELLAELPAGSEAAAMDVTELADARRGFDALAARMGGVDLVVLSAGTGHTDESESWDHVRETVETNALGFAALADAAYRHFETRGHGQLVGITSVAAVRESGLAPAYHASKAFAARYLAGLRHRAVKSDVSVVVTDVRPGFVDTAMAKGEGLFWVATPERAASQIVAAIEKQRSVVYVTKRWRGVAALLATLPGMLYRRAI